jgi:hypothetical protein
MDDTQLDAGFRLRLPQQLKDRLQEAAAAGGNRSVGSLARELIARGLEPLTAGERAVWGDQARRDPATGRVFENASGSHSEEIQAKLFAAEERLGRALSGVEVARILAGDSLENSVADAAASLEELK